MKNNAKQSVFSSPIGSGFLFAFISAALFAVRPIIVKLVYAEGVDSLTLIAYRMAFSAPVYLFLLAYFLRKRALRKKLTAPILVKAAGVGLLGYFGASYFDLLGLQFVTAQLGRMILYTYPTFVVLLGAAIFGQAITSRTVVSLLITYMGVAVIFGHDLEYFGKDVITGGMFITTSAVFFAFYLLLSKQLMLKLGSGLFTCIALLSASLGIFVYYTSQYTLHYSLSYSLQYKQATTNAQFGMPGADALWLIFFIAIFCTVIPTFCTTAAVTRIGADRTSIVAMLGPAFTSVFAVWVLGEAFTGYHALGIVLVVLGVANLHSR